jgi:uncharacterized protein YjbI with pentapeptide repeats
MKLGISLRRCCCGAVATVLVSAGAMALSTNPAMAATCPTVAAGTGTVTPAPAPGVDWDGCDLENANLSGANLTGANLSNSISSFVNFTGATLANVNLSGSNLDGANLRQTDLSAANLSNAETIGLESGGVTASAAPTLPAGWSLQGGYLIGSGAYLEHADLANFDLADDNLYDTDLDYANLSGANMSSENLIGANLVSADLAKVNLTDTSLLSANIQGANLAGATLSGVQSGSIDGEPTSLPVNWSLIDGYLMGPGADLVSADLDGAAIDNADLADATLYLATFVGTSFANSNLRLAYLDGANLTGVTWTDTICPDGSNSDSDGGTCAGNIDDLPPAATPTIAGTRGADGWYTSAVTVSWNWKDANATINSADCQPSTASTTQGGAVMVTATCTNTLGGTTSATETLKIDTTAPQVVVTGVRAHAVYALGHVPHPGSQTTDIISGVAANAKVATTMSGSAGVGIVTATCAGGTDNAGNQAGPVSVRYTVAYGFSGFSAPKPGATLAKSAHSIVIRFRLTGAKGKTIGAVLAKALARERKVRVTLSGARVSGVTTACSWNSATAYFHCSIRTPHAVRAGRSHPYTITVTENVGAGPVAAPAVDRSHNPETVYFR